MYTYVYVRVCVYIYTHTYIYTCTCCMHTCEKNRIGRPTKPRVLRTNFAKIINKSEKIILSLFLDVVRVSTTRSSTPTHPVPIRAQTFHEKETAIHANAYKYTYTHTYIHTYKFQPAARTHRRSMIKCLSSSNK
jgi:hypothetical protein